MFAMLFPQIYQLKQFVIYFHTVYVTDTIMNGGYYADDVKILAPFNGTFRQKRGNTVVFLY